MCTAIEDGVEPKKTRRSQEAPPGPFDEDGGPAPEVAAPDEADNALLQGILEDVARIQQLMASVAQTTTAGFYSLDVMKIIFQNATREEFDRYNCHLKHLPKRSLKGLCFVALCMVKTIFLFVACQGWPAVSTFALLS